MTSPSRIIGHEALRRFFEKAIANNSVPSGILLTGPKDIGKFSFALFLAQMLNINSPETVRHIQKNICADVVTIGDLWQKGKLECWETIQKTSNFDQSHRTGKSGAPRRTNTIGVEDIHSFLRPLQQKGVSAWKVGIIRDAHRMTVEAANALLKNLEEPGSRTLFILTTHHAKSLPETIVSRCQVFPMFLHSNTTLSTLFEGRNISPQQQEEMLMIAQGRSEVLKRFLSDSEFFEEEKRQFQSISKLFLQTSDIEKLRMAHTFSLPENEEEFSLFLENFTRFLRSVLVEKAQGKSLEVAQKITYEDILRLFDELSLLREGLRAHANKKLLLEHFFLSLP